MEKNKKFWFFLESYIYVSIKTDSMLLYDTHTGNKIHLESVQPIQLVNSIYEDGSLGSVELEQSDLEQKEIRDFVDIVIKNGMGKLLEQGECPVKPVVLLPILSLNLDVEKLKDKENVDMLLSKDISKYLLDVNIILNSSCQQHCKRCHDYCRQFFCCNSSNKTESLPRDYLKSIMSQISYYPVRTINITGGNIYQYMELELFNVPVTEEKKEFNFYIHYLNYQVNPCVDKQNLHLLIDTPLDMGRLNDVYNLVKDKEVKYHLIVEGEAQYEELESALSDLGIEEFDVHPYYNEENLSFFEQNVYLAEEDITANTISMREIYRNQKLNANSFGSLYFMPNGDVKANMNEEVLGNVGKDRIIDIIRDEMMQNTAWRKVRSLEPCTNCHYQYLCPPLSNYERAINKPNLCHVFPVK